MYPVLMLVLPLLVNCKDGDVGASVPSRMVSDIKDPLTRQSASMAEFYSPQTLRVKDYEDVNLQAFNLALGCKGRCSRRCKTNFVCRAQCIANCTPAPKALSEKEEDFGDSCEGDLQALAFDDCTRRCMRPCKNIACRTKCLAKCSTPEPEYEEDF